MGGGRFLLAFLALMTSSTVALKFFDNAEVILESDSPSVLDAPLIVTATLVKAEDYDGPFYFSFSDDASPMHYKEIKTNEKQTNYTLSYSYDEYGARSYTITCRVYVDTFIGVRDEIAKNSVSVQVKNSLTGHISVEQLNSTVLVDKQGVATLRTNVMTTFVCHLYDPSGYFNSSEVDHYWFINDTSYGPTNGSIFFNDFTFPSHSTIEVFVVAKKTPIATQTTELFTQSNTTGQIGNVVLPDGTKTGMFKLNVDARVPMTGVNVLGDKMIKHGALLNLTVTFNGTGPWTFCWHIVDSSYNATGKETCESTHETTSTASFPLVWYLRNAGESAFLIIVDNKLNHIVKQVGINVYDVPSRTPVSLIVIPMCSGLIAVVACISGVFVFMTFKRNLTGLETADFDFSCPDEQLEYKTFWERLRDSMVNALSNSHKDDESHVSSVSSRSVQGPPVGIHYGSIT